MFAVSRAEFWKAKFDNVLPLQQFCFVQDDVNKPAHWKKEVMRDVALVGRMLPRSMKLKKRALLPLMESGVKELVFLFIVV